MEAQKLVIDFLKEEDNDAILDLSHRCIQHGAISVYPDRSPKFNRIHKQIDPDSFHMVARRGDRIIGCFGVVYTPIQYEGKTYRTVYVLDFKVDPEFQNGMTAYRLSRKSLHHLFEDEKFIGFATIIKGNQASQIFTRGRADFPGSSSLGEVQVNSMILLRKRKVNPKYTIEHPTEEDIPELVKLYSRFYEGYKLAPKMSEDLFRYYLKEIEGIDLENMWVARENGVIKAVLCAWDENVYKRYRVLTIPRILKVLLKVFRFLSVFMKMPASINPGESLRQKTLVMTAHDQSIDAFSNLIKHVNNIHLGTEYTVLQTHFHKEDDMMMAQKGFFGLKLDIEVYMMTAEPHLSKEVASKPGPVLFEWPNFI